MAMGPRSIEAIDDAGIESSTERTVMHDLPSDMPTARAMAVRWLRAVQSEGALRGRSTWWWSAA